MRISVSDGHGTGFFVAAGLILTCAHVVKKARESNLAIEVYWNGQSYATQITSISPIPDLALLQVSLADHPCVLLSQEIELSDPLMSYGYPDDYPDGDTSTYEWEGRTQSQEQQLLKFKGGQVRPGMSGSPLLNRRTGQVCGVVKLTRERDSDLGGRAIPTETVLQVFAQLVALQEQFHLQDRRWRDCLVSLQHKPEAPAPIWNVPYRRNLFFTGREDILNRLHDKLKAGGAGSMTPPQAISGLGGIGKTQTAVEYTYRYRDEYHDVLWVRADTQQALVADFVTIASLLNMPEKDAKDQSLAVNAVKRWLEVHTDWLLILDYVDDLTMVGDFLPSGGKGHILLTTRAQATGNIESLEVAKMEAEEGALFLLRRAKIITQYDAVERASVADRATAREIVQAMDGLPLALDQAGAYIEETGSSLSSYLELYQRQHTELLKQRGGLASEHPQPVATTWSLSFEKVQKANPAAADLLRLCAFLSPDAIPEKIITAGAPDLGRAFQSVAADPLKLNAAIGELRKYSLIHRNPSAQMLNIHRLVQDVLKDEMNKRVQRQWAERAVRAVQRAFPDVEYTTWPECQKYITHALVCAALIAQWSMAFPEAAQLLNQAGSYLYQRAQYVEAEPFLRQALAIREQVLGPEHSDLAESLNNLAMLYVTQGKYTEAEPRYQRALAIMEKAQEPGQSDLASVLNNLAQLYKDQGKYEESEPLLKRALAIREKALGSDHPDVATSLNNLATLYVAQGKYEEAEPLLKRAQVIWEKALGPDHPRVATSLSNLAMLYDVQGKYTEAEPLYQRALAIREKALGPDHPDVAISLNNLAMLYNSQGKYTDVELLLQRVLAILGKTLGPDHPQVATGLNNLAGFYNDQGKYAEAEQFNQQALAIREKTLGPDHPDVATSLNNLAMLYDEQGKYVQAEPLLKRSLAIREKTLGPEHPLVATSLMNYAHLLRDMNREDEAAKLETRAREIEAKQVKDC